MAILYCDAYVPQAIELSLSMLPEVTWQSGYAVYLCLAVFSPTWETLADTTLEPDWIQIATLCLWFTNVTWKAPGCSHWEHAEKQHHYQLTTWTKIIKKERNSSIQGNVALFLSIILSDWEVLKDLILRQLTWKSVNASMYIFTTDRLPSSSKEGIRDKHIHTQCISLSPLNLPATQGETRAVPLDI